MPRLLSILARGRGQEIVTQLSTGEGTSLEKHWQRPQTSKLITTGGWTHVVLQERSRGPLEDKSSMHRHARQLDKIICKAGARTVFFMTWAASHQGDDQDTIARVYQDVALECSAMLAPVGRAWELALDKNGCPDLYHRDGRHASKAGAYLSACVFFTLLCGDPIGLSNRVEKDEHVMADLPDSEARLLQEAASKAVAKYGIA